MLRSPAAMPKDYAPLTRDRLEAGSAIPAIHYIDAQRRRRTLMEEFAQLHQSIDVLALPAAPTPAPPKTASPKPNDVQVTPLE